MVSTGSTDVTLHREISAAPGMVFRAWTDPVIAAKWLFRTPEGLTVRADTDPVEGGEFIFIEDRADERIVHVGEYVRVEEPSALDFVFSLDQFRTNNEVQVRFAPSGAGTTLSLTHKLDPQWSAFKDRTAQGWSLMLDNLERALTALD